MSESPGRKLNIILVSAEVAPFAKAGGLADVAGALPKALAALGHEVRVVMPCYPMVEHDSRFNLRTVMTRFSTSTHSAAHPNDRCDVLQAQINRAVPLYLVRHQSYFKTAISSQTLYPQPVEAYLFFSRAVLSLAHRWAAEGWVPDVIHCNDWHTGLIPVLMAAHPDELLAKTGSLFTIHNLAFQGLFGPEVLDSAGLSRSLFTPAGVEFYGKVNFLKAGLLYSNLVNTVSPTYAREIESVEFGAGLEGVLSTLAAAGRLRGILNGIDVEEYDPETDPRIAAPFDADHPGGKAANRTDLQQEMGLGPQSATPLVGIVGRLFAQKGLDILAPIIDHLIDSGFQFAALGSGDPKYERLFKDTQARYPGRFAAQIGFDERMGQRIFAGSDVFLMPSRFEPCGLGQLMSQRYGSVPVVRRTGGLADTVIDEGRPDSTGFVFDGYAPETLFECMKRVRAVYANKPAWNTLLQNALRADFSWTQSAQAYAVAYADAAAARCKDSTAAEPAPTA